MQSPLTPQRGRIESNPREYTHMEPRLCDELAVMPLGSRCILAVRIARAWKSGRPPDERGNPDARRMSVEIRTHESGYSDAFRMSVENRTESPAKSPKSVRLSTLIFQPSDYPRSSTVRTQPSIPVRLPFAREKQIQEPNRFCTGERSNYAGKRHVQCERISRAAAMFTARRCCMDAMPRPQK